MHTVDVDKLYRLGHVAYYRLVTVGTLYNRRVLVGILYNDKFRLKFRIFKPI